MNPEIGQTYMVRHTRKGRFIMRVDKLDETWASGQLVSGTAKAMMEYNVIHAGEPITIRLEHSIFTKLEP